MKNRGLVAGGGGVGWKRRSKKDGERPNWNNVKGHQPHEYC